MIFKIIVLRESVPREGHAGGGHFIVVVSGAVGGRLGKLAKAKQEAILGRLLSGLGCGLEEVKPGFADVEERPREAGQFGDLIGQGPDEDVGSELPG